MKLPAKGSRGRAIVDMLVVRDERRIDKIIQSLENQFTPGASMKAINDLIDKGVVVNLTTKLLIDERSPIGKDVIGLSDATREFLEDGEEMVVAQGEIVPPSDRNVYGPELKPSNFMRIKGTREGSDWSQYPSVNASFSKSA